MLLICCSVVFPVVMYRCESWTIKKAECQRIDGFEPRCWRKLLSPLDSKEVKPVNLWEIDPGYSLEGLMLKLKLQHFGHLMQRLTHWKRPWCWERLMAGGEEGNRGLDGWMAIPTPWTWVWANSRRYWRTGQPGMIQSMGAQWVGHHLATEQQLW